MCAVLDGVHMTLTFSSWLLGLGRVEFSLLTFSRSCWWYCMSNHRL